MLLGVFDVVLKVDSKIWRNILSKTFRRGGKLAIKIPTERSVALQVVKLTPSQVGSSVFSSALSSMVLKIEHTVALQHRSGCCFEHKTRNSHQIQHEDNPQAPLCPPCQLDS